MATYPIQIIDKDGKLIGELMQASEADILKFINKGFRVINKATNTEIYESSLTETIGVSDGLIEVG